MTKSDFDALKQYINTLTNEELNELQTLIISNLEKNSLPNFSEEELWFIFELFNQTNDKHL